MWRPQLRQQLRRFSFHPRVEIGGTLDAPKDHPALRKARSVVEDTAAAASSFLASLRIYIDDELTPAAAAASAAAPAEDKRRKGYAVVLTVHPSFVRCVEVAAERGDVELLAAARKAWLNVARGKDLVRRVEVKVGSIAARFAVGSDEGTASLGLPVKGYFEALEMKALVAAGRCEAALELLATKVDGDATPLHPETYAALVHVAGLRNAGFDDYEELLGTLLGHHPRPGSAEVFDALMERMHAVSPLVTFLVYAWRLMCDVPSTPASYAALLLSVYRQPWYCDRLLPLLTNCPSSEKNVFNPAELVENVRHILANVDALRAERGGADDEAATRLGASSGMPRLRQTLRSDLELRMLRFVAEEGLEKGFAPLSADSGVPSACFNCRAVGAGGWVMRILTDAHKARHITAGDRTYPHLQVYDVVFRQLSVWGKSDDVCALWDVFDYYVRKYQRMYDGDTTLRHTKTIHVAALRAAGRAGLVASALRIVRSVEATQREASGRASVELANAMLAALPGHDRSLRLYRRLRAREKTGGAVFQADAGTVAGLYTCALALLDARAPRAAPAVGRRPFSLGDAEARLALFAAEDAAAAGGVERLKGAPPAKAGHASEAAPDADEASRRRETLRYLAAELEALSYVALDRDTYALKVAFLLRSGAVPAAAEACVEMVRDKSFRPSAQNAAAWRDAAAQGPVAAAHGVFVAAVNAALEKSGVGARAIESSGPSPTQPVSLDFLLRYA